MEMLISIALLVAIGYLLIKDNESTFTILGFIKGRERNPLWRWLQGEFPNSWHQIKLGGVLSVVMVPGLWFYDSFYYTLFLASAVGVLVSTVRKNKKVIAEHEAKTVLRKKQRAEIQAAAKKKTGTTKKRDIKR